MSAMPTVVIVKSAFDADAAVWSGENSDLPGLNLEAASIEAPRDKIPAAVLDLLQPDAKGAAFDVPIEIIAQASTRARSPIR